MKNKHTSVSSAKQKRQKDPVKRICIKFYNFNFFLHIFQQHD